MHKIKNIKLTEDLSLRLISEDQAEDYIRLVTDNREILSDQYRFMLTHMLSESRFAYARGVSGLNHDNDYHDYLLYTESSYGPVGNITVHSMENLFSKCGISFFTDRHHSGKGYAAMMVQKIVELCFGAWGMSKVFAKVVSPNIAAAKVLEKAGFRHEAYFKQDTLTYHNTLKDVAYYGLLKSEPE